MHTIYEGQTLTFNDHEHDFIEIVGEETTYLNNYNFYIIPKHTNNKKQHLVVNYYKNTIVNETSSGLLRYIELDFIETSSPILIHSESYEVLRPVEYEIFNLLNIRYLKIESKLDYKLDIEFGILIEKDKNLFQIHGMGKIIYIAYNLVYEINMTD